MPHFESQALSVSICLENGVGYALPNFYEEKNMSLLLYRWYGFLARLLFIMHTHIQIVPSNIKQSVETFVPSNIKESVEMFVWCLLYLQFLDVGSGFLGLGQQPLGLLSSLPPSLLALSQPRLRLSQ